METEAPTRVWHTITAITGHKNGAEIFVETSGMVAKQMDRMQVTLQRTKQKERYEPSFLSRFVCRFECV
jgi:hypothetical protein